MENVEKLCVLWILDTEKWRETVGNRCCECQMELKSETIFFISHLMLLYSWYGIIWDFMVSMLTCPTVGKETSWTDPNTHAHTHFWFFNIIEGSW